MKLLMFPFRIVGLIVVFILNMLYKLFGIALWTTSRVPFIVWFPALIVLIAFIILLFS